MMSALVVDKGSLDPLVRGEVLLSAKIRYDQQKFSVKLVCES